MPAANYERSAHIFRRAPSTLSGVEGGVRGMTSLAPPGADTARRGRRSGRISRAWARQRREDFFGYRKRGFNQAPRNLTRRLAPHQFTKLMEGKRGFGGHEGWEPPRRTIGSAQTVGAESSSARPHSEFPSIISSILFEFLNIL